MLLGTTFAWFTDTKTTGVNKIQAGTLKVDLQDADDQSLVNAGLTFRNKAGSTDILWEPGATFETQQFKIVSTGNLALKYKLELNGVNVSDNKLMEVIKLKVVDADGTAVDLENFEGYLTPEAKKSGLMKITATMDPAADNQYQDQSCTGISITVFATQHTYEQDINGTDYDENAMYDDEVIFVNTPDDLVNAFANLEEGALISIGADLDMTGKTITPVTGNKGFTMKGNGHTISNLTSTESALFVDHSGSSAYFFYDVKLENCSVNSSDNYAALFVGDGDTSGNVTIDGCEVKNCTVHGNKWTAMFIAYNSGYDVNNNGPVYGNNTIRNCTVVGGSVTGGGSTGVAVGHAGGNPATNNIISNLTISGTTITGEDAAHEGIVVGTAHVGITVIENITIDNVTTTNNTNTGVRQYYGRNLPGDTGKLTIDGVEQSAT